MNMRLGLMAAVMMIVLVAAGLTQADEPKPTAATNQTPAATEQKPAPAPAPTPKPEEEGDLASEAMPAPLDPKVEATLKKVTDAWNKLQSIKANVKIGGLDAQPGRVARTSGSGVYEYRKHDAKQQFRMEYDISVVLEFGAQQQTFQQNMLMLIDGEHHYILTDAQGQKSAVKKPLERENLPDPPSLFETLREKAKLTVLPDEKIGDDPVYVLEAEPGEGQQPTFRKVVYYFRHDGVMVKQATYFTPEEPVKTLELTNIETNVPLPDDHFKFVVPEGVELREME